MSEEKVDPTQFEFSEEQLGDWLEELEAWAKKHKLNPQELCIVLGFLHEWLKSDLGIEVIHQEYAAEPESPGEPVPPVPKKDPGEGLH